MGMYFFNEHSIDVYHEGHLHDVRGFVAGAQPPCPSLTPGHFCRQDFSPFLVVQAVYRQRVLAAFVCLEEKSTAFCF